jgi:hypothetical protein
MAAKIISYYNKFSLLDGLLRNFRLPSIFASIMKKWFGQKEIAMGILALRKRS